MNCHVPGRGNKDWGSSPWGHDKSCPYKSPLEGGPVYRAHIKHGPGLVVLGSPGDNSLHDLDLLLQLLAGAELDALADRGDGADAVIGGILKLAELKAGGIGERQVDL